jgi:hypothetical protein
MLCHTIHDVAKYLQEQCNRPLRCHVSGRTLRNRQVREHRQTSNLKDDTEVVTLGCSPALSSEHNAEVVTVSCSPVSPSLDLEIKMRTHLREQLKHVRHVLPLPHKERTAPINDDVVYFEARNGVRTT